MRSSERGWRPNFMGDALEHPARSEGSLECFEATEH
jgi:hypothetical protein